MIKVAVIADSHFCEDSRFNECVRLHAWMAENMRGRGVELVLHAGDVYERKSTPRERAAVADWVQHVTDFADLVIVRGNHDVVGDLPLLERLTTERRVKVVEAAEVVGCTGAVIGCLAWPSKASVLAASGADSHAAGELSAGDALRNVLRGLGARMDEIAEDVAPRILLAHAMVRGSLTSVGQPLMGCDLELGLDDLSLARADAYALGHIHLGQEWSIGEAPVFYPGSPRRTAFGEVEDKAYELLTFDGPLLVAHERVVVPATPMVLVHDEWGAVFGEGSADGWMAGEAPEPVAGAEIRFRYSVAADKREAAKAAAAALRERWLGEGALSVKLEEEVIATSKARAPEVAAARTLADKLRAFWAVRGTAPAAARAEALVGKALALETELGADGHERTGALRWEKLRVRNVGPFRGEHELDLTAVPGPLVAITGPNGAGKSTTLELLAGALYRDCPTRGSLAGLATARDAMVETTVVNGSRHVVRQHVDAISGKGEGAVFDAAGAPLIDSAKVRELDAWVAQHMPAPSVLYAGQFAPQGRRGLLDLKASERKALIAEMLGVQHLETLAKAARARAEQAKSACAAARARIDELPVVDGAALAQRVAEAEQQVTVRGAEVRAARSALEAAKAAAGDVARTIELYERRQGAVRRVEALRAEGASLDTRARGLRDLLAQGDTIRAAVARAAEIDALVREAGRRPAAEAEVGLARTEVERLAQKLANNRRVLERENEIRAAAAQHAEATAAVARAESELTACRAGTRVATDRHDAALSAATETEQQLSRAQSDERRWLDVTRGSETARAAAAGLPGLRERAAKAAALETETSAEIEAVEALRLDGKDRRIAGLRHGLEVIAAADDEDAPAPAWAASALASDEALATELEGAPAVLAELRTRRAHARADSQELAQRIVEAERAAARLADMEAAERELEAARDRARAAAERRLHAVEQVRVTLEAFRTAQAAEASTSALLVESSRRAEALTPTVALAGPLENARTRIEELAPQHDAALERLDRARSALAALPDAEPLLAERAALGRRLVQADELSGAPALLAELERQLAGVATQLADGERELAALPEVEPTRPPDFVGLEVALARAEHAERGAVAALDRAQGEVEAAVRADARRAELGRELARLEGELADWVRLGQDLGRDGLQAAEIDAAVPELNELANDLLHRCHGPRFTVELRTDRLSADGKRTIEALDVRVLDTERGRDALAETYSGGECVIVGEALSLALTTLACRGKGERPTLVRDESGAALSPENARAYVAMLRLAAKQIDADRVLLVSHTPEVQDLCDGRVRIDGGAFQVAS